MLEVRGIKKAYKDKTVLDGVSFSLNPGQSLGVAGHNGSGKSTLLSIIAQVLPADEGEVLLNNVNLSKNREFAGEALGYAPQEDSLLGDLTVRDTLFFWQRAYGLPVSKVFEPGSPAAILGLEPIQKSRVSKLSGGARKRVSIAIALLRQPKLLLLDEALSSLDRHYRLRLEEYISDFRRAGGIILYCGHYTGELIGLCDRILILRDGQKVFDGEAIHFPTDKDELDRLLNPLNSLSSLNSLECSS